MSITRKFAVSLGLLAVCLLLVSNASAQTNGFIATGSSAMWQSFAVSARVDAAAGAFDTTNQGNCWPSGSSPTNLDHFHIWTGKSTSGGADKRAIIVDNRAGSGNIPSVKGNIWIVWTTHDPDVNTPTNVCLYVNVDSAVGDRALFAFPQALITLPAADSGVAGDNVVGSALLNGNSDEALQPLVFQVICGTGTTCTGISPNVAMSDIRAEDALFATRRVLCASGTSGTCLYYPTSFGGTVQTTPFTSAFSTAALGAADWELRAGGAISDPISGQIIPGTLFRFTAQDIGAAPVVVFVNKTNNGVCHLGDPTLGNINTFTLAAALDGTISRTGDLFPLASGTCASIGMNTVIREALSGTYNTMEFDLVRSRRVQSTQENGNIPTAGCPAGKWLSPAHNTNACPAAAQNPLSQAFGSGGTRKRAVGTGDLVGAVSANADSLGYAFWSFGNFASAAANVKYLTLDGVDPIQATYGGGAIPTCVAPCPGALGATPFAHVKDGSYPVWAPLQMIQLTANLAPLASSVVAGARNNVINKVPDFVPAADLNVFRSHYTSSPDGIAARNGHCLGGAGGVLTGGQMGGAVYNVQADFDSCSDNGTELTEIRQ